MPVTYTTTWNSSLLPGNLAQNALIVPLTCGVSAANDVGACPTTNLYDLVFASDGSPLPVSQQFQRWSTFWAGRQTKPLKVTGVPSTVANSPVAPWVKIFKQTVKLRFTNGTNDQPNVITVSVVRINPKIVGEHMSIARRIDGPDLGGPTTDITDSGISLGQDYTGTQGLTYNYTLPGTAPVFPTDNTNGTCNVMWNKALWDVDYQKSFTLGYAVNPAQSPPTTIGPVISNEPSQFVNSNSQFEKDCTIRINYGGMKLTATPSISTDLKFDPQHISTMRYADIPVLHKRWLVIHQSNPPQSNGPSKNYKATMSFQSIVSGQCPT